MATISLVMIVKNEESALPACLESVKGLVDEWVIVDTGSTDRTPEIIAQYTDEAHSIPFVDFVTTKNQALELATGDYILFMDADERLLSGGEILRYAADNGEGGIGARIIEGAPPHTITNEYYRMRLWRNHSGWLFVGPGVHEVVVGPPAGVTWHADVVVHHDHGHRKPESYERRNELYIGLLTDALAKDPDDLRAWFYLARTYKDAQRFLSAIETYQQYHAHKPVWRDEMWQAAYDEAECWRLLGEYEHAFVSLDHARGIDPRRAETECLAGEITMQLGDWERAARYYEAALNSPQPTDVMLFLNPRAYNQIPHDQLALIYDKLHRYDLALHHIVAANDAQTRPDTRLISNLTFIRKYHDKHWLFALGHTPEPLAGGMLDTQGAGGLETSYIELPKALAARGQQVTVLCRCEEAHMSDGVFFLPFTEPAPDWLRPDIVVASRWFEKFALDAQRIVWLHDAWFADLPVGTWEQARHVVVASPWHRHYVAQRAGPMVARKTRVIPLGIHKAQFAGLQVKRRPHQLIYSSNPDRGLQALVDVWPRIVDAVPDVNLVITYGWEGLLTWSDSQEWGAQQMATHDRLVDWAEQAGNVQFTGRLPKHELYRRMAESAICAYPNNFFETFCITALESQAAGVPMVTSALGALPTTLNLDGNILLKGDPLGTAYQKIFAEQVIALLLDKARRERLSTTCLDYIARTPCDWLDIAHQWLRMVWEE